VPLYSTRVEYNRMFGLNSVYTYISNIGLIFVFHFVCLLHSHKNYWWKRHSDPLLIHILWNVQASSQLTERISRRQGRLRKTISWNTFFLSKRALWLTSLTPRLFWQIVACCVCVCWRTWCLMPCSTVGLFCFNAAAALNIWPVMLTDHVVLESRICC
jgi:hypothetical protein